MDLAVLDGDGVVRQVVADVGHPDRAVPWNRTDALALRGSRVFLLPAGKAGLLGDHVRGADVTVPSITLAAMSNMILAGEEGSWRELLDHLRENPEAGLDEALTLVKRELRGAAKRGEKESAALGRRKLGLLLDRILADETLPYRFRDEAAWHAPLHWARSLFVISRLTLEIEFGSKIYVVPRACRTPSRRSMSSPTCR